VLRAIGSSGTSKAAATSTSSSSAVSAPASMSVSAAPPAARPGAIRLRAPLWPVYTPKPSKAAAPAAAGADKDTFEKVFSVRLHVRGRSGALK
jgi:hypothetical protein